jgi:hypothetical protein
MEDNQEQKREIGGQGQIPGGEDLIPGSSMFLPLAESLRLQGQYDEAIEILKGGLERKPDALPARLLLGRCYLEKGWIPQAKEELERVAREIEECFSVYRILSQVYLQAKDVDKALEALRKTLCFQAAEEGGSRKVTPLEMGLFHGSSRPPFATPSPPPVAPDPPSREPSSRKPAAEEQEKGAKGAIRTDTLAEIYTQQGHLDRALSVYLEILAREPENAAVREKCEALKRRMQGGRKAEVRRKVQEKLEKWLAVVSSTALATPF